MNTRHSDSSDPGHAPERNLSSLRHRSINISLAVAAQAARVYPKEAREACLWLANLAANSVRIQRCWQRAKLPDPLGTVGRITETELCEKVGLDRRDVYAALTGHEDADIVRFCAAIQKLRAEFESQLPPLATTADARVLKEAFEMASDDHEITWVIGKWQHGKTAECERHWLKNLHRCVWLDCPEDNFDRTFFNDLGGVLGIGTNHSKKTPILRAQIKSALGVGLIDTIIVDEAHNLWPENLQSVKPKRVEFLRHLKDALGIGSLWLTTEQSALALELSKQHNARYAPGQIVGRRYQYELRDAHTDKEIRAIAVLHAGNSTPEAIDELVEFAKNDEGYLGSLTKSIAAARKLAGNHTAPITAGHVAIATRRLKTSERVKALALCAKPTRRGRLLVRRSLGEGGKLLAA